MVGFSQLFPKTRVANRATARFTSDRIAVLARRPLRRNLQAVPYGRTLARLFESSRLFMLALPNQHQTVGQLDAFSFRLKYRSFCDRLVVHFVIPSKAAEQVGQADGDSLAVQWFLA
jgi:hypothetical protein